jgi:hypothetical protein
MKPNRKEEDCCRYGQRTDETGYLVSLDVHDSVGVFGSGHEPEGVHQHRHGVAEHRLHSAVSCEQACALIVVAGDLGTHGSRRNQKQRQAAAQCDKAENQVTEHRCVALHEWRWVP